ncbi:protein indeterminate-domain 7-like [Rutidosis leptorrhynchoides]|uniref:protein indeterminate-domain 7-like n=1 Tax=Rutidosis leptorrhynchoides TaxID=125765 RepID=UPI003A9A1711
MSNISGGSFSSGNTCGAHVNEDGQQRLPQMVNSHNTTCEDVIGSTSQEPLVQDSPKKKKRSLPGTPDPSAQVIALSPTSLMAKNKYVCEICNKGFQRDQNLQLHRRGHNLPWKLRQRTSSEIIKRVYICPEPTCVHHNPARALGDLTGIKKHFSRKHGEKKWKCDKCSKRYAVQCDWKAHSKICGTKEYKCDCGTIFSRRDSFITHRAFCDALAEENSKLTQTIQQDHQNVSDQLAQNINRTTSLTSPEFSHGGMQDYKNPSELLPLNIMQGGRGNLFSTSPRNGSPSSLQLGASTLSSPLTSATALLQKAAQMGVTSSNSNNNNNNNGSNMNNFVTTMAPPSYGGGGPYHGSETLVDHYHPHQSQLAGVLGGGFSSPFQENSLSRFFSPSINGGGSSDGIGLMCSSGFMNQGKELVMNNNNSNVGHEAHSGLSDSNNPGLMRFKRDGNGDNLTVDFMGVGGMRLRNFSEQHHQEMEI